MAFGTKVKKKSFVLCMTRTFIYVAIAVRRLLWFEKAGTTKVQNKLDELVIVRRVCLLHRCKGLHED